MLSVAGIDYSLTSPAVCVFIGGGVFRYEDCKFFYLTDIKKYAKPFSNNIHGKMFSEYNAESERYCTIADWAVEKIIGCEQIGLEDYAYSRGNSGRVFHIAENTGILKYKIWKTGTPIDVFSPTLIKKYATGKGNAKKDAMYESFKEDTGVDLMCIMEMDNVRSPLNDIVDAYFICKYMHSQVAVDTTS
jgi:Holliday junction resolvasome RuvABC endonuclease subunit